MSIRVDCVRISGFRGLANVEINLPRVTLLIGANNSGKTSVIKALHLALGDYARFLTDEDFYIGMDDKRRDSIKIDVRLISTGNDGMRQAEFAEEWQQEFGDKIRAEADNKQFVAIQTIVFPDRIKGGHIVERYNLDSWPQFDAWDQQPVNQRNKIKNRFDAIPFISIDAQRDIHSELKEKSSFVGRVLSSIEYQDADVAQLETMVAEINREAINKSDPLKKLKQHLDHLSGSFDGNGQAELTPFPKKIRDLSKRFSVHFGESEKNSFSMEYHGMGTRSWASMLTVKAFTELKAKNHADEIKPFFPIMAAEEPEAHLHPNAQRTLYRQLIETPGQIIISTHSPYLAALAEINEIRVLSKDGNATCVNQFREVFEDDDMRKIKREVVHSRGELLFSKAIVLSEGETEEQALPELYNAYTGELPFAKGVNFVGVNGSGKKYKPFFILSKDLNIPIYVFSDGEEKTISDLKSTYEREFGETDIHAAANITILDGTDFEGYLLSCGCGDLIESAILECEDPDFISRWIAKKQGTPKSASRSDKPPCKECNQAIFESELRDYTGLQGKNKAMLDILDSKKPKYAKAVTEKLIANPAVVFPPKIIEFFEKIKAGV